MRGQRRRRQDQTGWTGLAAVIPNRLLNGNGQAVALDTLGDKVIRPLFSRATVRPLPGASGFVGGFSVEERGRRHGGELASLPHRPPFSSPLSSTADSSARWTRTAYDFLRSFLSLFPRQRTGLIEERYRLSRSTTCNRLRVGLRVWTQGLARREATRRRPSGTAAPYPPAAGAELCRRR